MKTGSALKTVQETLHMKSVNAKTVVVTFDLFLHIEVCPYEVEIRRNLVLSSLQTQ